MTTCAIYTRVSTEDQEREGTSLETQVEACRKKAHELGYEVSEQLVFRETYSGLKLDRPLLTTLRDKALAGEINAIIIHTPDRLSRVGEDILALAKEFKVHSVKLQFVREHWDDTLNGKLVGFMLGWASEFEAAQLKERSSRGKRARAAAGKLPSGTGHKLYGYDYLPGKGTGEGIRYVNDTEAKHVRDIFTWLVQDSLTVNGITRRLRALEVPTPGGSEFWRRQTVYRILTNPAYIGKTYAFTRDYVEPKTRRSKEAEVSKKKTGIIWKPQEEWVQIPGATPAIIPEDLFEAAQKILRRNKELATRNAKRQYLLSGFLFCRRCGARYIGYVKKWRGNGKPYEQRYYRCGRSQSIASPERCDNRQLNGPDIEQKVWNSIRDRFAEPDKIFTELQRKEDEAKRTSQLYTHWLEQLQDNEARVKRLEKRKDRAWSAFTSTGDKKRFSREIAQADADLKELLEQKAELEEKVKRFQQHQVDLKSIKQACEVVSQNLEGISFEDKRRVLKELQIKVWVDGDNPAEIEGTIQITKLPIESSVSKSRGHKLQSYPFLITS